MFKKSSFRKPIESQHAKVSEILLKSAWLHFCYISQSLKLSSKMSGLVICAILGLFVNTLTSDGKYSLRKGENLRKPIQMQLSKKQETFSQFFVAFLKFRSSFETFGKKDYLHSLFTSEIKDYKGRG